MKPMDKIDDLHVSAETIIRFMAQQDALSDEQSQQLAAWLQAREAETVTLAERRFITAAREYVLAYPAELAGDTE